jgi:hypothetical protein
MSPTRFLATQLVSPFVKTPYGRTIRIREYDAATGAGLAPDSLLDAFGCRGLQPPNRGGHSKQTIG